MEISLSLLWVSSNPSEENSTRKLFSEQPGILVYHGKFKALAEAKNNNNNKGQKDIK